MTHGNSQDPAAAGTAPSALCVRCARRRHGRRGLCRRCRSTGCSARSTGSTARRASPARPPTRCSTRTITIRFDANVAPGLALALRAGADHADRSRSARTRSPSTAPPTFRSARARHGDLQRLARAGRRLLQQARMLLLHRAAAAAGPDRRDAGELLRRSADRRRQGRARRSRTSRCPTRSIPWRRRSRASPDASRRQPPAAPAAVPRTAARQDSNRVDIGSAPPRQKGSGSRTAWPTRTPSTTTITS